MSDFDTSQWPKYIVVATKDLRVEKVEHEVVEWVATFCSEDRVDPGLTKEDIILIEEIVCGRYDVLLDIQTANENVERQDPDLDEYVTKLSPTVARIRNTLMFINRADRP